MILDLAVRGQLVEQRDAEEPARKLLKKIRAEKKRISDEKGKAKLFDEVSLIDDIDAPFAIPKNWIWTNLGEVAQIVGGGTPRAQVSEYFSENEIAWITPSDLYKRKEKFIAKEKRVLSKKGLKNSSAQLMPAGSVLFSSRAPIGYVAIAANSLATNQGFKSCVPYILEMNEYIYYFLKSVAVELDENASGTTFKEVPAKMFQQVLIPFPPLEEQKRIVAKVEELFAQCDALESRLENRRTKNSALLSSLAAHAV